MDIEVIKTEFLAICKTLNIPDSLITIASYEGMNTGDWWRRKKKDPNLFATISYQIKFSNSKKMDDLVEKLNDDATSNFKITKTWHSRMTDYRKQLKIAAVKAAREKGIYLTEAIGEKLGQAVTILENDESQIYRGENSLAYQYAFNTAIYRDQAKWGPEEKGNINFSVIKLKFEATIIYALQ